jgi:hypothetical protein
LKDPVSLEDLGDRIAARRLELGMPEDDEETLEALRNKGARRTDSKRALLRAIDDLHEAGGTTAPKAHY